MLQNCSQKHGLYINSIEIMDVLVCKVEIQTCLMNEKFVTKPFAINI